MSESSALSVPLVPPEVLEKVRSLARRIAPDRKESLMKEGEARADAWLAPILDALDDHKRQFGDIKPPSRANRAAAARYLRDSWKLLVEGATCSGARNLYFVHAAYRDHLREEGVDERIVQATGPRRAA